VITSLIGYQEQMATLHTDHEAYLLFSKMDPQQPERFARAVADPKNRYPEWLRTAAIAFLANPTEWHSLYSMQAALQEQLPDSGTV
jgi:hypothetical protein